MPEALSLNENSPCCQMLKKNFLLLLFLRDIISNILYLCT